MFILEELFCPKGRREASPKGYRSAYAVAYRFAYDLDDFCAVFEPRPRQSLQVGEPAQRAASQWRSQQLSQGLKIRRRSRQMSLSEIMTILIAFHQSYYRNFKRYYLDRVCVYWVGEFPKLPSYQRFVEWMLSTLLPWCIYLKH